MRSMSVKKAVSFFRFHSLDRNRNTTEERRQLATIAAKTLMGAYKKKAGKRPNALYEAFYYFDRRTPI